LNFNEKIWLDRSDIEELVGLSKRTILRKIRSGDYHSRLQKIAGKDHYKILLTSLPVTAQKRYWDREIQRGTGSMMNIDLEASLKKDEIFLPDKQDKKALAWAELLSEYKQVEVSAKRGTIVDLKKQFVKEYNKGAMPEIFALVGRISYATIERRRKQYEASKRDYQALADKRALEKYDTKKRSVPARAISYKQAQILLSFVMSPNGYRIGEAIRKAREAMENQGIVCTISTRTFQRFIKDWREQNTDLWLLTRKGEKALNDKNMPYIQRDRDQLEVGDVIVADGHTLNFQIIDPSTGKPRRMTLILAYDMKSSFPVGWEIMPTENTQAIAAAFRRGILTMGFVPRVFYLDNGKAFRSKYFQGMKDFRSAGFTGLFARLGCETVFARPYHGQSKTVERFFGSFAEFERSLPAYTGTSIDTKPAHMKRGEKWHRKMRDRTTENSVPTLLEAHWMIANWFAEYVQREQQDGYLKGQRPLDVFQEGVNRVKMSAEYAERRKDPSELRMLMMRRDIRTLYRNGIRFLGRYYYSDALYRYEKGEGKHKLHIRYDIAKPDSILVFFEDGGFVCEAIRTDKVHPMARILGTEEDKEKLHSQLKGIRGLEQETKKIAEAFFGQVSGEIENAPRPLPEIPVSNSEKVEEDPPPVKLLPYRPEDEEVEPKIYMFETQRDLAKKRQAEGE
jgi:putative transposase